MKLKAGMLAKIEFGKKDYPVVLLLEKATREELKSKNYDWHIKWWYVLEIDTVYLIPEYLINIKDVYVPKHV